MLTPESSIEIPLQARRQLCNVFITDSSHGIKARRAIAVSLQLTAVCLSFRRSRT
ncbi:protein of unknown function (plasmid) [Caballeronia sp. S22]